MSLPIQGSSSAAPLDWITHHHHHHHQEEEEISKCTHWMINVVFGLGDEHGAVLVGLCIEFSLV